MTTLDIPLETLLVAARTRHPWVGRAKIMRMTTLHLAVQRVRYRNEVLVPKPDDATKEVPVAVAPAVVMPTIDLDLTEQRFTFDVPEDERDEVHVAALLADQVVGRLQAPGPLFDKHPENYLIGVFAAVDVQLEGNTVTAVVTIGSVDRTFEDA